MAYRKISYQSYRGHRSPSDGALPIYAGLVLLVAAAACFFFSAGINFLAFFFFMLALACFAYMGLSWLAINSPFGKIFLVIRRLFEIVFALGLISFIILEIVIAAGSKTDPASGSADYLIIPGAGLNGSTPSLILQSRLDGAYEYLTAHPGTVAVVSGGMGPGESVTEASAMAAYLEAKGISPDRILREEKSRDTIENIRFSLEVIRSHRPADRTSEPRIAALSNEFHVFRIELIAKNEGADLDRIAVPTPLVSLKLTYYIREYFSLLKVFLAYL